MSVGLSIVCIVLAGCLLSCSSDRPDFGETLDATTSEAEKSGDGEKGSKVPGATAKDGGLAGMRDESAPDGTCPTAMFGESKFGKSCFGP